MKKITYVANPLCSWCYGFSPVIEQIRKDYTGKVDSFSLILGHLSHGKMDDDLRDYLRDCWQNVEEATGAKFNYDFFSRQGFVYDSTNPCKAICLAKEVFPTTGFDFQFFKKLQGAFYQENQDITDLEVLVGIASEIGLNPKEFSSRLKSGSEPEKMKGDSAFLKQKRINSYLSLLLSDGNKLDLIIGYQSYEAVSFRLDSWLDKK